MGFGANLAVARAAHERRDVVALKASPLFGPLASKVSAGITDLLKQGVDVLFLNEFEAPTLLMDRYRSDKHAQRKREWRGEADTHDPAKEAEWRARMPLVDAAQATRDGWAGRGR